MRVIPRETCLSQRFIRQFPLRSKGEPGEFGVLPILPDKENVFEIGAQQQLSRFLRLNLTVYQKRIEHFSDKDQFFDTGIIFPITISSGRVTGEELRLETSEIYGVRGFLSYANARADGVTPINGGLFLGESVNTLNEPGLIFANDHDESGVISLNSFCF